MEDALYEIASMRLFAGLSLDKAIPDHTTILKFRHLLAQYCLALAQQYQKDTAVCGLATYSFSELNKKGGYTE
jgi:hypothetical protein